MQTNYIVIYVGNATTGEHFIKYDGHVKKNPSKYWEEIEQNIQKILKVKFELKSLFLSDIIPENININKNTMY